ncbi:MAG: signal transduction histidine kinase [Cellvibrionaceae bacterium]|jgi:signal transduction histidine kinase
MTLSIKKNHHEKVLTSIALINKSLTSLKKLTDDILNLKKITHATEDDEELDASEVMNDAPSKLAHVENYEKLTITKYIAFPDKPKPKPKPVRITAIIENLISNSIKCQGKEKMIT